MKTILALIVLLVCGGLGLLAGCGLLAYARNGYPISARLCALFIALYVFYAVWNWAVPRSVRGETS